MLVRLSSEEVSRARQIAIQRYAKKGAGKNVAKNHSPLSTNILGITAELALAKHLSIEYEPEEIVGGDKYDLYYNDLRIEVKCPWSGDELRVMQSYDLDNCDILVLMKQISVGVFEVRGWIWSSRFEADKEPKTYPGYEKYPMWVIHRKNLEKPEFLVNVGV